MSPSLEEELNQTPLSTRFTLGEVITPLQSAFLDRHGFLIFNQFATDQEVKSINHEIDVITGAFLAEHKESINGIPLFKGKHYNGGESIQRLPFTSMFSSYIKNFISEERFRPIRTIFGEETRIGHNEKDGCVVNTYFNIPGSAYPKLGWHTDGLRDLAYLKMPKAMLNVGLHLSDCPRSNGGLRILPGTHKQGFLSMCFHKPYFVYHKPDPNELSIETRAGDLTIHDGRLWHRVQQSPHTGAKSFRRTMYIPFLTDAYHPKHEESKTPIYHKIGTFMRKVKSRRI